MDRSILRPISRRQPLHDRWSLRCAPHLAFHVKVALVALACVLGLGLGIGSAVLGHLIQGPSRDSSVRRVALEDFHLILQRQAQACTEERKAAADPEPSPAP